jgi:mannose-1-phosphate guanylyltransferase
MIMRAIILVGGFGTRLRPLTLTTPKQMLPVAGLAQIERKIAHLVSHGVDDIVLSLGYKPDGFKNAYPSGTCAGAKLTYVVEDEPLGTAGAIAFAARETNTTETFLAMNGDTLTDLDVSGLIALHRSSGAEGTLALTPVDDPSRFGVVLTDDNGKVSAFIEKPKREDAPTNLINAGTYVFEPSVIDRIPAGKEVSIERETFPAIVADGGLYAGNFDKYWLDIGTPDAFVQGNLDALDQLFNGESHIGDGADVASTASVKRSSVGADAVIGDNASITESVILPGARIGANVTLDRSVVGARAVIGDGARLTGVSVVGDDLEVPAGTTLDGEKVSPPEA